MIAYPSAAALPLPQAEYSAKPVTNVVTTVFASGRPRRRRMGIKKYHAVKLVWVLSPAECDFFMGWWEHILQLGTLPFTVDMATGEKFGAHVVQLSGDPESSKQGHFWKVACEAVVLSKPELSSDEVHAFYAGAQSIPEFLAAEDNFNYHLNVVMPTILEN